MKTTFVLPLPPIGINKMYYTDRSGTRRKDTRVSDWEAECLQSIKYEQRFKPSGLVLEVDLWFFFSNYRKNDIDGRIKCTLDMLEAAEVYSDDANLNDVHLHKRYDHGNPRLEVMF